MGLFWTRRGLESFQMSFWINVMGFDLKRIREDVRGVKRCVCHFDTLRTHEIRTGC